ncbi:MAG: glycosyl transferase family 36 [Peptococcaceae bacterium]|nr:glycosyl transferase family 36 [Peptococcaceae bacterium]
MQNPLKGKRQSLLPRVIENLRYLENAHRNMMDYVHHEQDLIPAAEWFLDNYYLLKDFKAEIRRDFPPKYERQLPFLNVGNNQGFPLVYDLMYELVEHTDSRVHGAVLRDFTNAYQELAPLSSGEIWAIPIMLKMVFLENVRRLAEEILVTQAERLAAKKWLAPFTKAGQPAGQWPKLLESAPRPLLFTATMAERLSSRIKDFGLDGAPLLRWLERAVSKQDATLDALIKLDHQCQTSCQLSMGNSISAIRFLLDQDWPNFFEEISMVQKILAQDPSAVYLQMDYPSRDAYRHQIERNARLWDVPEIELARKVVDLSRQVAQNDPEAVAAHIGYYLLGKGQHEFEDAVRADQGLARLPQCGSIRRRAFWYFGSFVVMMFCLGALVWEGVHRYAPSPGLWILITLSTLIPASGIILTLLNWLVSHLVRPDFLPKLDLREGIPDALRTVVVIPALLTHPTKVSELYERLEIYYLANQDPNLYFAILGDFCDASEAGKAGDWEIIAQARLEMQRLNEKYATHAFYFLHRRRVRNETEGCWMGWERKRGKLLEFNRWLLEGDPGTYAYREGDFAQLSDVKYVITIDCDTQLIRDSAKRLIGALAHPLHQARLDDSGSRILSGYGLLQPRIGVTILSAENSHFAKIFTGEVGLDPYASAVSDVYQDLFHEGIFTGKGIYDLNVFYRLTKDAFRENTILSHDLIEGLVVRAGLVTDIQLLDGYPAKFHAEMRRQHRWVRGDWQLLPWLLHRLSALSRWKITDNLRRSLEAPLQCLLIALGFTVLPGNGWLWSLLVFADLFLPVILYMADHLMTHNNQWRDITADLQDGVLKALLLFVFLPYKAYIMVDAILRSLVRQYVTHQSLLEWETADDTERRLRNTPAASWRLMWPSVLIVGLFALLLSAFDLRQAFIFAPFAVIWTLAPWVAYQISCPAVPKQSGLTEADQRELRLLSRRIWAYFEEYVTRNDNWLPPDNVQINPARGIAHRTSPTNIGVALLAHLSAYDFGYLTLAQTVARIERTLQTTERLERWQGHLYNWYDTQTLEPLNPRYVSTVDSGNLAVYLLTLQFGLQDILGRPILSRENLLGLQDTAEILRSCLTQGEGTSEIEELEPFLAALASLVRESRWPVTDITAVQPTTQQWRTLLNLWPERIPSLSGEGQLWLKRLERMRAAIQEEFDHFASARSAPESVSECTPQDLHWPIGNQVAGLQRRLQEFALAMDFRPLFDKEKQLFSIGYHVQDGRIDQSYYDLLASEARQAGFFAIAKGDIAQTHWFRLGRSMTKVKGQRCLVSWSGTMFEYLMPLLIMRNYPGTILAETYQSVVRIQANFSAGQDLPWGVSESAFYAFDKQLNYQYKAFGVPGLGLKRGLIDDLVIAPYASFLALQVQPGLAMRNIHQMISLGFLGSYGLYEAIDYTRARLPRDQRFRMVQSFMSHHQGMSLLSLTNVLRQNHLQNCFHEHPLIQATELILQEKMPLKVSLNPPPAEYTLTDEVIKEVAEEDHPLIQLKTPLTKIPVTHMLGNGQYSVLLTNAGSGFSKVGQIALTRWRSDFTRENWGMYFYIQNLNSGNVWSATHQPLGHSGKEYRVFYAPDHVEYQRQDGNIQTRTKVVVSSEDPVEIRRISLTNHSKHSRDLEVTSYFEVILSSLQDDEAHPVFNNLFIQTEFNHQALLATRRSHRPGQNPLWLMHTVCLEDREDHAEGVLQYETDRFRFIGRGRDLTNPLALELNRPLSNTSGSVLEPIMSLRRRIHLEPNQTRHLVFSVGLAYNREEVIHLAEKYQEYTAIQRALELAWTHSQMELRHLNLSPLLANKSLSLGAYILYANLIHPQRSESIRRNVKGQSSLWPHAISGDLPVILARIAQVEHLEFMRQLLKVHDYWLQKGMITDLVILNEDSGGYMQNLYDMLRDLVAVGHTGGPEYNQGHVHILLRKHLSEEDLYLLRTVARLTFNGEDGSLLAQMRKISPFDQADIALPLPAPSASRRNTVTRLGNSADRSDTSLPPDHEVMQFFNGFGGFNADGTEYVIQLGEPDSTPLPWINIQANPNFGFQVSATGGGYTWSGNSRENKLTTWSNDPVLDSPAEVLYLSDQEEPEGKTLWTLTPEPIREAEPYIVRFGQGYSVFEHTSHGLQQELTLFTPRKDTIKFILLRVVNQSGRRRNLSATYYAELVLGVSREQTAPYIVTSYEPDTDCLLARNVYQEELAERLAFLRVLGAPAISHSGDRTDFIGRYGSLRNPEGLRTTVLRQRAGAGYDPCFALQAALSLEPQGECTIAFLLGEAHDQEDLQALWDKYPDPSALLPALEEVRSDWRNLFQVVQVQTPDRAIDLMLNRWLIYQTTVCRLWARSAFYQSGGAYGYRDQLQDVMAFSVLKPEWTRAQIILHSQHQFREGDVQHWWHPERGKGIRTKFSDDLLWLPYVTLDYLEHTQDFGVLEEVTPFLEDAPLGDGEDERYSLPRLAEEEGSVYEHCIRAIERSLRFGERGLPLIGSGDWNDGMNRVGSAGQGESVWLGWFLYIILKRFSALCAQRNDAEHAERYQQTAEQLSQQLELNAWDGGWYRRAYFDDGTPLGSADNNECQIDALAQSWAVLAGGEKESRLNDAMLALENYLWRKDEGLMLLLTPPFDAAEKDPGYIRGYLPGIRENGGQYTHAAVWAVMAFAARGQGDKAVALFQMLNPIHHARTEREARRYKTEPYVMAADIYANAQHSGRGGWTWYTGAAGWMYQAGMESILGFYAQGEKIRLNPCISPEWPEYRIDYRYHSARYHILVRNPQKKMRGISQLFLDEQEITGVEITCVDDGREHQVVAVM